jgi:ABC-2 type transport system ATP-binding protein
MDEAERCDRIALMRAGSLIALDSPAGLKRQAFPGALFEIDPAGSDVSAFLDGLRARPETISVVPYGMRFHAALKAAEAWSGAALPPGARIRRIEPSLEDVFIRLVEGGDR